MAKITLPTISGGYASVTQIEQGFNQIESEFQNKVLYRNNPSGEANQMENNIDMNSNNILNVSGLGVQSLTIGGIPVIPSGVVAGEVPIQTGHANKFLQTDGTTATWEVPDASEVSFTQAGVGASASTVQTKLNEIISVKDYGAVGDGVTDDTTAIQNALNELSSRGGGKLVGSHTLVHPISTTLTIGSNITLENVYLYASSALPITSPMIKNVTGDTGLNVRVDENITFLNCIFDGGGRTYPAWDVNTNPPTYGGLSQANSRGHLVRMYSAKYVKFIGCEFKNHHSIAALVDGGCLDTVITGCDFHDNGKVDDVSPCIWASRSFPNLTPTTGIKVVGNSFHDCDRMAATFVPTGGGVFANNTIKNMGEGGIHVNNAKDAIIIGNLFEDIRITDIVANGIEVETSDTSSGNVIISNNIFRDIGTRAISVVGGIDIEISGNIIENCGLDTTYPGGPLNYAAGRSPGDPISADKRGAIGLVTGDTYQCKRIKIHNNIITDVQGTPTTQNGITLGLTGTPTYKHSEIEIYDNRFNGIVGSKYNITRTACESTVKVRDGAAPFFTEQQAPAVTGQISYTTGFRPSFIMAHAITVSTTKLQNGMGVVREDWSTAVYAERGNVYATDGTTQHTNRKQNNLLDIVNETGASIATCNFISFDDTGFTVDWTLVNQRPWVIFIAYP